MIVVNAVIVLNVSLRTPNTHSMSQRVRQVPVSILLPHGKWGQYLWSPRGLGTPRCPQGTTQCHQATEHWGAVGAHWHKGTLMGCSPMGRTQSHLGNLGGSCPRFQVWLHLLPRYLGMHMPEEAPGPPQATRRRSSLGLMVKADEYMLWKARTELLFEKQKERDGLMKTVLEKIGE